MSFKKIANKYFYPPAWRCFVLSAVSVAALLLVFAKGRSDTPFSIVIYILSFYTLCVDTLALIKTFSAIRRAAKNIV